MKDLLKYLFIGLLMVATGGFVGMSYGKMKICNNMASFFLPVEEGLVTYACRMDWLDAVIEIDSILLPKKLTINIDKKEELD